MSQSTKPVAHTAGPWRVMQGSVSFPPLLVRNPVLDIAVCDCAFGKSTEEAEANAHLIAACPEMAEALQRIEASCDPLEDEGRDTLDPNRLLADIRLVCQAALKKAGLL